ncbi:MAG: hypothetical protein ACI9OT_001918, partial [Gammaproteobacteria bacterium]
SQNTQLIDEIHLILTFMDEILYLTDEIHGRDFKFTMIWRD